MGTMKRIALALVIIGAINWGLIGFFQYDLVASIFGGQTAFLSRVIYALVGLSGLVSLAILFEPTEVVEKDLNRSKFNNVNYNTEFGKEPNFKKPTDFKEKNPSNKGQNQPKKKK